MKIMVTWWILILAANLAAVFGILPMNDGQDVAGGPTYTNPELKKVL